MDIPGAPGPTIEKRLDRLAVRVRWWPAGIIILLTVCAVAWVQLVKDDSHQHRNLNATKACLAGAVLLLLWFGCFSRIPRRARLVGLASLALVTAGLVGLLRIRGVTGDLIPIFEWRWRTGPTKGLLTLPESGAPRTTDTKSLTLPAVIDGWPQFLGPNRNATVPGPRLQRDWLTHPPQKMWRRPLGAAWSGFAVARGRAITQEQRGPAETVAAYAANSGQLLWTHTDPVRYFKTLAGEGPRATPAIAGDQVYTVGATGILNCLDEQTGRLLWSRAIMTDNDGAPPGWGLSVSPLVLDHLVVVSAGGPKDRSLVAYSADTGHFVCGGGHDRVSYSSPVRFQLGGQAQILMFNAASLAGHDPVSGKLLWEYRWSSANPNVAVPVLLPEDRVLVSSGYGVGSEAIEIRKSSLEHWTAQRAWKSTRLRAKFTNVVFFRGFIYGLDDGTLTCLEAATGESKWKDGRYGHGQVILVGSLLLVMAENGEVCLVDPVPEGRRELGRFAALNTKTWNPPALAGEFLFVRNDLEAACFRLPVER